MPKANRAISTTKLAAPTRRAYVHYDINTAAGLIDVLGGEEAVAVKFDTTAQAVETWAISGHIHNGWHLRLFAIVNALGKTISPEVFGFLHNDEVALALSDLMRAAHRPEEGGANV